MKTAEEMVKFCDENNLGKGMTKKWELKHFQLIEKNLDEDEKVILPFMGLKNYISATKHDSYYAFAITNKRIIMAQQKMLGQDIKSVSLNNINDITLSNGPISGTVYFDTYKEQFNVNSNSDVATNIYNNARRLLMNNKIDNTLEKKDTDKYERLRKLKSLYDDEIITKEEFEKEKDKILQ